MKIREVLGAGFERRHGILRNVGVVLLALAASVAGCGGEENPSDEQRGGGGASSASGGTGNQEGGASSGGRVAETGGSGGEGFVERPRWFAFPVNGGDSSPLYLGRTTGDVEPILLSDDVSGFSDPSFSADGRWLLWVDYFCCGFSNGVRMVSLSDEGPGMPELVHEERSAGATVRFAQFAPAGDWMLAQFVDGAGIGRFGVKRLGEPVDAWRLLTPGGPWSPSQRPPVWSADGMAVLFAEEVSGAGQTAYLVELSGEEPEAHAVLSTEEASADLVGFRFTPDGERFVIHAADRLLLGDRSSPSEPPAALTTEDDYPPFYPVEVSPDGERLLFTVRDALDDSARTSLVVATLTSDEPEVSVRHSTDSTEPSSIVLARWLPASEGVVFLSDESEQGAHSPALVTFESSAEALDVSLVEGESVSDIVPVAETFLLSFQDAAFNQTVAYRRANGAGDVTRLTVLEEGEIGWTDWKAVHCPSGTGAFYSFGLVDVENDRTVGASLTYFDAMNRTTSEVLRDLPDGATLGGVAKCSPSGDFLVLSGDIDADTFEDIVVVPLAATRPEEARVVGSVLDVIGGSARGFFWQP